MLERLLAHSFTASDVLQSACYYIAEKTNSKGAFISVSTLDYFDVVVGSIREKRIGGLNKENINMIDITQIEKIVDGKPIVDKKGIYFIKSDIGWFFGLDSPVKDIKKQIVFNSEELVSLVNSVANVAYPVFNHCIKQENKFDPDRDLLTGTLSRAAFFTDLKAYIQTLTVKRDLPLWLFYMDFNNFKAVNDSLGHDMGDRVLQSMALEIRSVFAGYGSVYRIGGDEFVGLCFGVDKNVVDRIKKRIEKVTRQAPCGLFVNVAVSVEQYIISEFADNVNIDGVMDKFLQKAEKEMYLVKIHNKKNNDIDCSQCKFAQKDFTVRM